MAKQAERRDATRDAITGVAKELFGRLGYNGVTIDDIAKEANVAKGGLYHHFPNKKALFEAVFQSVASDILNRVIQAAATSGDIILAMRIGNRTFFEVCAIPETTQIYLKDGPAVLGWDQWRKIDGEYFGGILRQSLNAAMEKGRIQKRPLAPLVGLILGAVTEAAIDCANSDNFDQLAHDYLDALNALIDGIQA
jgi:AcrR family transcriptional regulator